MRMIAPTRARRRREAGYALLMVVFLAATMLIFAVMAAPSLLTEGRREKEKELIWRGNQYARGIRLYYRKNGRFPQKVEDLTKAQNNIRFLRQAYRDPMNAEDGSWRMIYVGPSGQIIGSTKLHTALQGLTAGGDPSKRPPAKPGLLSDSTDDQGQGQLTPGSSGAAKKSPAGGATDAGGTSGSGTAEDQFTGKVFGGNIIGVGSKVNRASIRIFDGSTNYREWEFLWDPTKEAVAGAVPVGTQPGANQNNLRQTQNPPPPPPPPPMQ